MHSATAEGSPILLKNARKKNCTNLKVSFYSDFRPTFQLMITPRTLELQTSFCARWNCPELKFMKLDEKNEL